MDSVDAEKDTTTAPKNITVSSPTSSVGDSKTSPATPQITVDPETGRVAVSGPGHTQTKRRPLKLGGAALFVLCFQTLGIIYSDIGTSPLYVLNGIWSASGDVPSEEDVLGGISSIFWALTLLPLCKYVLICMQFGTTEGEGGTFALLQGLYPRKDSEDEDRTLTSDSGHRGSPSVNTYVRGRHFLSWAKWPLRFWALFGTALTLSDGIFTPAVSVTSAVGGIAVAKASIEDHVTVIAIAFLILLFLVQRFGTATITNIFAPVTCLWLAMLAGTGIANITHHPGIFRAVDPSRAVLWFKRTKDYDQLAGVLLAITGCEAMFANLGQFNATSIRLSFSFYVYPCLILAYFGQGAKLISEGEAVLPNLFYLTIPGGIGSPLYWIMFVLAILATLIASQALITATFSLTQQLINMKSLPPLELIYTSSLVQGQVYVPVANYTLGIACIIVVAVFKDLASLTNAYGFAVATVLIVTTSFLAIQIVCVKHLPIVVGVAFFLVFGFFDGLFWGASLRKVPHGAWVPLAIGAALTFIMMFWTWARGLEDEFDGKNRKNPRHFIVPLARFTSVASSVSAEDDEVEEKSGTIAVVEGEEKVSSTLKPEFDLNEQTSMSATGPTATDPDAIVEVPRVTIAEAPNRHGMIRRDTKHGGAGAGAEKDEKSEQLVPGVDSDLVFVDEDTNGKMTLARMPTCAVFHKLTAGPGVPHAFYAFVRQMPALPQLVIFLSVRVLPIAYVPEEDAYVVNKVRSIPGFYGVTYRLGYRDDFFPSVETIVGLIADLEARVDPANARKTRAKLIEISKRRTHIIPNYNVTSKPTQGGWFARLMAPIRRILIEDIYRRLSQMFPETANWSVNNEELLHVGVNAPI